MRKREEEGREMVVPCPFRILIRFKQQKAKNLKKSEKHKKAQRHKRVGEEKRKEMNELLCLEIEKQTFFLLEFGDDKCFLCSQPFRGFFISFSSGPSQTL